VSYAGGLKFVAQPHPCTHQGAGAKARTPNCSYVIAEDQRQSGGSKAHTHEIEGQWRDIVLDRRLDQNEGRAPDECHHDQKKVRF